jgi:hypothetical protein
MTVWSLHVGYSKTGTTALQRFLAERRKDLLARGVLYPDARYAGLPLGMESHNEIAGGLAAVRGRRAPAVSSFFRQLHKRASAQPGVERVVLSAEGFTGHPNVLLYASEDDFRAAEIDYISELRALIGGTDTRIIVYLRRQDHWLEASANQRVRYEGRNAGPPFSTAEDFLARQSPRLNYLRSLECWAEHFGAENLIVRPYEPAQIDGGSVIRDFLGLIGLPELAHAATSADRRDNPGLSRDVLEFKRRLNLTLRSRTEAEVLGEHLSAISMEMGGRVAPLLSPALRRAILEECEPGNRTIAQRYLGRESGNLFEEPWPDVDAPWEPYAGLTPETEAEISRRLTLRQSSAGGQLMTARKRISFALQDHLPQVQMLARALRHGLPRP